MIFQCWNEHADRRPSFSNLVTEVSKLLDAIAEYIPVLSSMSTECSDLPDEKDDHIEDSQDCDHLADVPTDLDACTDCSTSKPADSN